jgi:type IV pilus assembly protein PilN
MKITLNLATRPYADQGPALKQLRIGMLVLVVVLIGLGLGEMHFHQSALRMRAQEDAVDQSIARVRREQLGYQAQMQQPANARVLTQAQFLNHLFDEKAFSWTVAMEDLERVLPGGVQVTAIEPARGKDGRLTLKLRISGQRERSVEMVRNMEHSQRFVSPRITGENAENGSQGDLQQVRDTGKVSFDVLAEYNPPSLDERKAEIARQKRAKTTPAPRPALNPGRPQYVAPNPQPGMPRQPQVIYPGPRGGVPPGAVPLHGNRPINSTVPSANGGPQ